MLLTFATLLLSFISSIQAIALSTVRIVAAEAPPQPTEPPTPTGPICTLVDGGEPGGTFCNRYTGGAPDGTLTDTNWISTVTPAALSSKLASESPSQSPAPLPDPAKCGEVGAFEITFDDLPTAGVPDNFTSGPPIFNPVNHFFWGDTFTYLPPPTSEYVAQSGKSLAHSVASENNTVKGSPHAGTPPAKGFGAGPRNELTAYWFNITAAYVQCDFSEVPEDQTECTFTATPWRYDPVSQTDHVDGEAQSWTQKRCLAEPCRLNRIEFGGQFNGLSEISFYGVIAGKTVDFYMDSLSMQWYNNTCEAGLMRQSSRR